jgi:hypothetical protein
MMWGGGYPRVWQRDVLRAGRQAARPLTESLLKKRAERVRKHPWLPSPISAQDFLVVDAHQGRVVPLASVHLERAGIVPSTGQATNDHVTLSDKMGPQMPVVADGCPKRLKIRTDGIPPSVNLVEGRLTPPVRQAERFKQPRQPKWHLRIERYERGGLPRRLQTPHTAPSQDALVALKQLFSSHPRGYLAAECTASAACVGISRGAKSGLWHRVVARLAREGPDVESTVERSA